MLKGSDLIVGSGGADRLAGFSGDDELHGGGGRDDIFGNDGDDVLHGDRGRDHLRGGVGKDQLDGGAGSDVLRGDAGADVFVFGARDGKDMITDFTVGQDRIALEAGAARFRDLVIVNTKAGAVVSFAETDITLNDVSRGDLGAGDFLFGA